MATLLPAVQPPTVAQAENDAMLIKLWLHGRPASTLEAYQRDLRRFQRFVADAPLRTLTLGQLQAYMDSLAALAPATRSRLLSTIKSLFGFAHKIGYLPFDPARAISLPRRKNTLAERILSEEQIQELIFQERQPRNRTILRLLYHAGVRVTELCHLQWRDVTARETGGQITVHGKGEQTRHVLVSNGTWKDVLALRNNAGPDDPVFTSRKKHGHLTRQQVFRIVKAAAKRVGCEAASPHWMRHAHASHALDRGAKPHVVQKTLGHASLTTTSVYSHVRPDESSSQYLSL